MEKEIIEKIIEQLNAIHKISDEDKIFNLDDYVEKILDYLIELKTKSQNEEDKTKFEIIWKRLAHTFQKEVTSARSSFIKARRKDSPNIREIEYQNKLRRAIEQINIDLTYIKNNKK